MLRSQPTALARWKIRKGLTWDQLAARAKVSNRLVRKAAYGEPIGVVYAEALARVTGLRLEDFAVLPRGDARTDR